MHQYPTKLRQIFMTASGWRETVVAEYFLFFFTGNASTHAALDKTRNKYKQYGVRIAYAYVATPHKLYNVRLLLNFFMEHSVCFFYYYSLYQRLACHLISSPLSIVCTVLLLFLCFCYFFFHFCTSRSQIDGYGGWVQSPRICFQFAYIVSSALCDKEKKTKKKT